MMMTIPTAPAGAPAADTTLPGAVAANGGANPGVTPTGSAGAVEGQAESTGLPLMFAQMLDLAGLAGLATPPAAEAQAPATEGEASVVADAAGAQAPLAAMMPLFNFTALPVVRTETAALPGTPAAGAAAAAGAGAAAVATGTPGTVTALDGAAVRSQAGNIALLGGNADQARQAAADAITAAGMLVNVRPQGTVVAPAPVKGGDVATQDTYRMARPESVPAGLTATAAPVTAVAQEAGLASDSNARGEQGQQGTSFRGVMASAAPLANDAAATPDVVKLAGSPDGWQQPLRAALGDRLQLQLQRNSEHAVIRLDPPNLGSIEISIRHSAGSLQVNLSASNGEVLRQLNAVGDNMRQDLSTRQFNDVAVTVSASNGRGLADGSGRGNGGEREQPQRGPGRALSEGDEVAATFAMQTERE